MTLDSLAVLILLGVGWTIWQQIELARTIEGLRNQIAQLREDITEDDPEDD